VSVYVTYMNSWANACPPQPPPPPPPPPPPSFSFRPTRFYCIIWNEIAIGTWGRCAIPSKSEAVRLFIKKVPDSICGSCISAYGSGQIMHCLKNMHGRLHAGIEWTKFQSQIYNKPEKIIEKKSRERLSNQLHRSYDLDRFSHSSTKFIRIPTSEKSILKLN
jgi:disulfide oxidoreductase YuzD